ncbi:MAG: hypothetical protein JO222_06620, partial [Frankiales bacterium]|nr:hypothetical protein [Frankiales bacterium]
MTQDPGSAAQMSERMQSLLSRAVEDQLSEQRQLAGAVAELRAQVAALTHQLSTLGSGSTSDLESAVAGIAGDIREAVRLLAERTDGVGRLVQQRGHDLAEIRASIAELTQAMQQHTAAVDGMTGGLKALPAFGQRIETLQGGLDRLHERLRGLEEITASVQGMQQKVDNLDGGVRELRHAFTGVAARAAELPSRTDIEAVVLRGAGPLDSLGNRLGRIETTLPSMLERLDTLAESLGAHGQRLDEVGANIGELLDDDPDSGKLSPEAEQELTVIRARLDELHERTEGGGLVDELIAKIDSLHEALLGEDGVQAQLDALVEPADEPEESLEDVVARAVADTER